MHVARVIRQLCQKNMYSLLNELWANSVKIKFNWMQNEYLKPVVAHIQCTVYAHRQRTTTSPACGRCLLDESARKRWINFSCCVFLVPMANNHIQGMLPTANKHIHPQFCVVLFIFQYPIYMCYLVSNLSTTQTFALISSNFVVD